MTTKPYRVVLHKNPNQNSFGIYIGEDIPSGIYIVTLEPNSPAAYSNIQPGDRVLAVNGQFISKMSMNPKEMILQIANTAESLTLDLEPSDVLQFVDYPLTINNNSTNTSYQYVSEQSNGIDPNLEKYIKSLFVNENLHIIPSTSSNPNEYILTSDSHSSRPHRRRHRKRQSMKTIEPPPIITDEQKENSPSLNPQRTIPNMGTSKMILRSSQQNPKDNEMHEVPEIKTLPNVNPALTNSDFNKNNPVLPNNTFEPVLSPQNSYDYSPEPSNNSINTSQQSFQRSSPSANNKFSATQNLQTPVASNIPSPSANNKFSAIHNLQTPLASNIPSSSLNNNNGFREVRLSRIPNFNGFGFHLQYNKIYYVVQQVEPNSPSERAGLRPRDVIYKINDQPATKMPHHTFVDIVNRSTELILLVQSYNDYVRTNPEAAKAPPIQQPIMMNMNNNNDSNKKDDGKSQNFLSKALTKLKSH